VISLVFSVALWSVSPYVQTAASPDLMLECKDIYLSCSEVQ